MSKNSAKNTSVKHWPSLVLASVAILVPVLASGIVTIFAEDVDSDQTIFDSSLFNADQFLLNRRLRHPQSSAAPATTVEDATTSSSASSVDPCDPSLRSSSASEPVALHYEDLTSTEREALQTQLRKHMCPSDIDPAYRALCLKMLQQMPAEETQRGLRNPNQ